MISFFNKVRKSRLGWDLKVGRNDLSTEYNNRAFSFRNKWKHPEVEENFVCLRNQPVDLRKSVKGEKALPSSLRALGLWCRFWSLPQVYHSRFLEGFEEDWHYLTYSRFLKSHWLLWVGDWTKNNPQSLGTEGNKSCPTQLSGQMAVLGPEKTISLLRKHTGHRISLHTAPVADF